MKRLLQLALVVWIGRWLAREAASYAARSWLPRGPAPVESERAPGWMPGPASIEG